MRPSRYNRISISLFAIFSLLAATSASAEETGLITLTGYNINEITPVPSIKLKFRGWAETGFTGNPGDPHNHSNFPVAFNDGAKPVQLHLFMPISKKK
ncbi:MAG: hypothetical protein P0107_01415 [Nitrosomonas sp.]|nr:hypothetical protein [Nitrosomonas sp.]